MATTESFGRGRIAETILTSTSVPFTLNVSKVPTNENQFITIDPDTNNEEILYYTTKTGTIGEAGTLNITGRGYNVQNDTQAVGNQKEHEENGEFKLALNHIIINDKMDLVLDNVVLSEIGFGNVLKTGLTVNNLTTVERDALTPANGAIIYNTTDNVNQQYIGGAWANIGDTGTADASETVAGKVEMATQAQYDAKTGTGETGALLVPQMGQLPIAATETTEGLVERATDAEVVTGTDTIRYTTPKQGNDNWLLKTEAQIITRDQADATATVQYSHSLGAVPKLIKFHAILATNQWSDGAYDGTNSTAVWATGTPGVSSSTAYSIKPDVSGSLFVTGVVTAMTTTTFDITWTRTGTPTGTFIVNTTLIA